MTSIESKDRISLRTIANRVMLERGLLPEFSVAARSEAEALSGTCVDASPTIRDLRELVWCSIDNDDSRDLDQLSVAVPEANGAVRILVAIADVDAAVKRGSAVDDHARTNTTSVYTAAQIFPMLPERLSTDLTSLGEDQERLAIVVDMKIDATDRVTQAEVYRAHVFNHAKLAYDSVAAWLEGTGPAPTRVASVPALADQLRTQDDVAQRLRRVRHQHGALSLSTPQAHAVYVDGVLSDLQSDQKNRAKELIEDFMIAANGVTARFLEDKGFASMRRVLRSPERWARIVALAETFGEHLPTTPDAGALNTFLEKRLAADAVRFPDVSLSVVKLLGRGEYAVERPGEAIEGHFGLAVNDYTHSTAPNRRFPDLITQRLLKAVIAGADTPYPDTDLTALALHCTVQEDNAAKVERQVIKAAAAMLLAPRIGQLFEGIITGASDKGTWVRILGPVVEGRIVRGQEGLDIGDRVRVTLVHTDAQRGFIDFERGWKSR